MTESPWLTRTETAQHLRVSPPTVDRWVREGRLTRYKLAGQQSVRFLRADVEALVTPDEPDADSPQA